MKTRKARLAELEAKNALQIARDPTENLAIVNLDFSFLYDRTIEEQARMRQLEVEELDKLLTRGWIKKGEDVYIPVTPEAIAERRTEMEEAAHAGCPVCGGKCKYL
jgi:hypothetical protein